MEETLNLEVEVESLSTSSHFGTDGRDPQATVSPSHPVLKGIPTRVTIAGTVCDWQTST